MSAVMAIFQKDPQVLITHPRRDLDIHRRHARQAGADFVGHHDRLLALAESPLRFQRPADSQIHLQSGARSSRIPTPSRKAISPASPTRSSKQADFRPRLPAADYGYPGYANMVLTVPQKRDRHRPQDGAGLRRRSPAKAGSSVYQRIPAKGQRPDQALYRDNPDMTDAILKQALDKMKEHTLLLRG